MNREISHGETVQFLEQKIIFVQCLKRMKTGRLFVQFKKNNLPFNIYIALKYQVVQSIKCFADKEQVLHISFNNLFNLIFNINIIIFPLEN